MLHEILLSLSGLRSPIWDQLKDETQDETSINLYASPPERAMLNVLAELSDLHLKVKDLVTVTSRSHPSPICRAVIDRIVTKHLRAFTNEVIQVEALILQGDARFVGAYKTVPLSTLVSKFQPWTRPLRWLNKTMQMFSTKDLQTPFNHTTGAALLEYLHKACHTGYADLKEMSFDLLVVAQKAWLQTLMPWILYGQLPSFGKDDFLVGADSVLRSSYVPYFVTTDAAEAVLAIGNSLNQVKSQERSYQDLASSSSICNSLMYDTIEDIKSLEYPLDSSTFARLTEKVNGHVSQNVLSRLLSESSIVELLLVTQEYLLLRNGEFSTSLIKQAAEYTDRHLRSEQMANPLRRLGKMDTTQINEAQAAIILGKTWSDLAAVASEHHVDDSIIEKAAAWLRLKTNTISVPVSTLLPVPSSISVELTDNSPLRIFITQMDIEKYRNLSAYLISLNRAQFQLTQLWTSSPHRRWHPGPGRNSRRSSQQMQDIWRAGRARKERRDRKMRSHWICVSRTLLVLSEICNFLHGEVINKSWERLWTWLSVDGLSRPTSSKEPSRPTTASSRAEMSPHGQIPDNSSLILKSTNFRRDPRLLARAHKKYLDALYHSVLLDHAEYVSALRDTFNTIDHYVALFYRIQKTWEDLDLHTDGDLVSAFADLPQEEDEVTKEMERTKQRLADQTHELIDCVGHIEKQKGVAGMSSQLEELKVNVGSTGMTEEFRAWNVRTLNPLLMKLDFVINDCEDEFEDALPDVSEDKF